jgi:signal transduction histidine kinase/ligand-binding sensor domain-containing protein/CheY-like chemotaxis protein
LTVFADAQETHYIFSHLSINEGLSHNHCYSILKDSKGFMWFGTGSGLSRYDGQNFKNYRHNEDDPGSIGGNRINDIVEDKNGILWIATLRGGLNKYDPEKDIFTSYPLVFDDTLSLPTDELNCLYLDSDSTLWYGTYRHGFGKFNKESHSFENYNLFTKFKNPQHAWKINTVNTIIEDIADSNILWIGSIGSGLFRFDKKTKSLQSFPNPQDLYRSGIHDLYMESSGELWVAYWGIGLGKYNIKQNVWDMYIPDINKYKEGDGYSNICISIEKKSDDEFWIAGGRDGLGIFNKKTKRFKFIDPSKKVNPDAGQGFVSEILVNKNDGVWIRDNTNGIYQIDPSRQSFKFISTKAIKKQSRKGLNAANAFAFEPIKKRYFVSTGQADGLYIFDQNLELEKTAASSLPTQYSYQQFTDVLIDSKGRIWILDWLKNKLLRYEESTNLCVPYPLEQFEDYPEKDFTMSALAEDKKGNIWIGSYYGGLYKFNPDLKLFKKYIGSDPNEELTSKSMISSLLIDDKGRICMGTVYYGIYIFDPKTEKFTVFKPKKNRGLIQNRIKALAQDKYGNIWVGFYTKGIQIIELDQGIDQKIDLLTFDSGLLNENIVNIISDLHQNMWVQTEGGLFAYDYNSKRFTKYDNRDGYLDYLNPYGMQSLSTGEICVGGSEGFIIFHPDRLYKNTQAPKVVLTGFRVGEKDTKLEKRIDYILKISLPYRDNFFTINFAALNFQLPVKNSYAYQLEGVDNTWVFAGNRNYATYTNISEGTYTFSVKACNNDLVWNENATSVIITILPPWYRSWLAYLLYGLMIIAVVYSFYYYQKRRWFLQTQLKLEHEEAKRLKELDTTKSKIYTNITHEFRTPLTIILGLADQILIEPTNNLKEKIRLIKRNGKSLLLLINQMLDLAKLETGNLKTEMINADIVGYLGYLTESFHSLANDKGIHLNFYSEEKHIFMDFDPEKIERLFTNLISNALKFTQIYGKVLVVAKKIETHKNASLVIEIQDNGQGISKENIAHIFDRFHQIDDAHTRSEGGTGIGLALVHELVHLLKGKIDVQSELGMGSTFTVMLPVSNIATSTDLPVSKKVFYDINETEKVDVQAESLSNQEIADDKPILLVIEDNKDVIYYLNTFLENDYYVEFTINGQEGIDKAIEIIPDIIISDVMMPIKDGFEVCQILKTNQLTSHIPIILLTAKATAKDRLSGLKHGADAYIMKPFNQEELEVTLKHLIDSRKKLQEYYENRNQTEPISNVTKQGTEFLDRLKLIIEKNMGSENFDIIFLSRDMHMSRSQLHRKLKALTNTTPALYIRKIRLEKAYQLLKETDTPISDIAFSLGFSSPSYFTYSFSEMYGYAPSDLRK